MQKRGQLTIFVILGLIILLVALATVFLIENTQKTELTAIEGDLQIPAIKNFIQTCIKTTTQDAIFANGLRGGYYNLPELSTITYNDNLPYYKYKQNNYLPSIDELSKQLGLYLDDNLNNCFDNFASFVEQGYDFELGEIESSPSINQDNLDLIVKVPLKINLADKTATIGKVQSSIQLLEVLETLNFAKELIATEEDGYICINCLEVESITYDILEDIDGHYVIQLSNHDLVYNNNPYMLNFAIQYQDNEPDGSEIYETIEI
tara:strand:+ start:1878 stop:2666 length:789 start_codon:yes stop_codon:yes gene_type:complete